MSSNNLILQKVIDDTEGIFKSIAENYPKLLSELSAGIEAASKKIQNLETHDGSESLNEFLLACKNDSRRNLTRLDSFKKENENILKTLTGSINEYRKSQTYIDEIKDISESLQIVSLNALCNAVKAGKGGEGFSVITENLKEVTEDTISKTESLEHKNEMVKLALSNFYSSEDEISNRRRKILSMLEDKVISGMEAFQSQSGATGRLLNELTSESDAVRKNILQIMEELQQQDLIRQTIDQIILSINELPPEYISCEQAPEIIDENLDESLFCLRIIELSESMIDEVITTLEKTIRIFTDNFRSARDKLEFIQEKKEKAVEDFFSNIESFRNLALVSEGINRETGEFSERRTELISLIEKLIEHVQSIAAEFDSFDKISGWLQNVAVLSRIELSRSSSLAGMKESVMDMTELVERIQEQIMHGEEETGNFIKQTTVIFNEYKSFSNEESVFLKEFTDIFIRDINEISGINNRFTEELKTLNFFTDEFYDLFDLSENELKQLKEIKIELEDVRSDLNCINEKVAPAVKEKIGSSSISDWEIKDDNMNKIIEKFTIYSHKKTAADVSGFDVEDSALDAGEITLF